MYTHKFKTNVESEADAETFNTNMSLETQK